MLDTVLQFQFGIDIAMTMLIWLVQLVIYPAFMFIYKEHFRDWHHRYMRTISFIVIPLILAQALCIGCQCLENNSAAVCIQGALFIAAWITTFTLSVPCHKKLQAGGWNEGVIRRLIHTNWIRTIVWSSVMLLDWI